MPVPASINDLSTTAGSNSPPGSEPPAVIDDYLRAHAAFIAQLRDGKQASDATLTGIAGVTIAANQLIYATGVDTFAATGLTAFARTLLDDADAATARATLELTDSGWQTPTLLNSFNQGDEPFRYRTLNGVLYVVGSLKRNTTPTAGLQVCVLPVGARPSKNSLFVTALAAQVSPLYLGLASFSLGTNGNLTIRDPLPSSGTSADNYQVYINYSAPL